MSKKIWFITGASRGFGRIWCEAALSRGDKVVATARDVSSLQGLVDKYGDAVFPLALDVTDRSAVFAVIKKGHTHFGRLDVIISNAGYGLVGAVEEIDIDAARANFDTNFFGTLSVTQAALPLLRTQAAGHIILVASTAGLVTFPTGSIYQASKFAVVALGETLAQEVAEFGIKVTIIEPGPFATDFSGSSKKDSEPIAAYAQLKQRLASQFDLAAFPDPHDATDSVLSAVDAEKPPLHLLLGKMRPVIDAVYAARQDDWDKWVGAAN